MKRYLFPKADTWNRIMERPEANDASLRKSVKKILKKVQQGGDKTLLKLTRRLDGVRLDSLVVPEEELLSAESKLDHDLLNAITQAKANIERFHLSQREETSIIETMPGVRCWRRSLPIEKVGLYIPGGTAPLFSTVLMLAIPAVIAGCRDIILCSPPHKDGAIHPAILYAAKLCGVTRVIRAGGAQAIAAMAFGTESVPRVQKIFGPGNRWVTEAKLLVQQAGVAIDMPAGPSEVLVIADETAVPAFVAADLLSQAEHGPDSQVILLTTSEEIAEKVDQEIKTQLVHLPRMKIANRALDNSRTVVLKNLEEAIAFSNLYAPEHLILSCENAGTWAQQIRSAGSVFLGNYSPESAGDYASGTNHTLPTNGYANMYSGVSLDSFVKKITFQELSPEGLRQIGNTVMTLATAEGLEAHRNAVAVRLINKA